MLKHLLLSALAITLSISAGEARQSTLNMSCAQAAALVQQQGAIVLSTGRHTFDRFVARRSYCLIGEHAARGWAPTHNGRCLIGYVCRPGDRLFDD